jgi:hypothetical protein
MEVSPGAARLVNSPNLRLKGLLYSFSLLGVAALCANSAYAKRPKHVKHQSAVVADIIPGRLEYPHWVSGPELTCKGKLFPGGPPPGYAETCPLNLTRYHSSDCAGGGRPGSGNHPGDPPLCPPDDKHLYIRKTDVVWFASKIEITKPLLTNGGNVILVADEVYLEAPIDTRIYVDHSADAIEQTEGGTEYPLQYYLGASSNAYKSYQLFYHVSNDVWDAKTHQYVVAEADAYPELPHGLTPRIAQHFPIARDGENEHNFTRTGSYYYSLDKQFLKSGNISIFANKISFCAECGPNRADWHGEKPLRPECEKGASPLEDRTLINASGIDGSRGWIGAWGCKTGVSGTAECPLFDPKLNQLFSPSPGGEAGSIDVNIVNASDFDSQMNRVLERARASPGNDRTGLEMTAPWFKKADPAVASRCVFQSLSAAGGQHLSAGIGDITVNDIDSDKMVVGIANRLTLLEAANNLSYRNLIAAAANEPLLRDMAPSDQLEAFLLNVALSATHTFTQAIRDTRPQQPQDLGIPKVLQTLTADPYPYTGVSPSALTLVRFIHRLPTSADQEPLRGFFSRTKGLFAVSGADPVHNTQWEIVTGELRDIQSGIESLKSEVIDLNYNVFTGMSQQEGKDLRADIATLQQALEKAKQDLEDSKNPFHKIQDVLQKVGDAVKAGTAAYEAWGTGSYDQVFKSLGSVSGDIGDIVSILKKQSNANPDQIAALLQDATDKYNAFLAHVEKVKADLVGRRNSALLKVQDLRKVQASQVFDDLKNFEEMTRQIVLTRMLKGGGNGQSIYEDNLSDLDSLFRYDVNGSKPLFPGVGQHSATCTDGAQAVKISLAPQMGGTVVSCVLTEEVNTPHMLKTVTTGTNDFRDFPLIGILPGDSQIAIQLQLPMAGESLTYGEASRMLRYKLH